MATFLLILCALCMSAAAVLAFRNTTASVVAAYCGLWAASSSHYAFVPSNTLLFWSLAVLVVVGINMARNGSQPVFPKTGRRYIVGGALLGMIVGMLMGQAGMIVGSAVGACLGGVAFTRMIAGRPFARQVWRAVVAIGLPSVVAMVMMGITLVGLIPALRA